MYSSLPWKPSPVAGVQGAGGVASSSVVKSTNLVAGAGLDACAGAPGFSSRWVNLRSFVDGSRSFAISSMAESGKVFLDVAKLTTN